MVNIKIKTFLALTLLVLFTVFSLIAGLEEGDICFVTESDDADDTGICARLKECPEAIAGLRNGIQPIRCGFKGREPIVCCQSPVRNDAEDDDSSTLQTRVSGKRTPAEKKCYSYAARKTSAYQQYFITVVGGVEARPKEFPFMVAVGYGSENNPQWFCGGTLISDSFVLSAAHCLDTSFGEAKYIRIGDLSLSRKDDDAAPQEFRIAKSIPHPEYQWPATYHDIALIKLDRKVIFTPYVHPACLYTKKNDAAIEAAVVIGWGQLGFTEEQSDVLMKAVVKLATHGTCAASYQTTAKSVLPQGISRDTQMCAGGQNSIRDACLGDSGGPLVTDRKIGKQRMAHVIGVTSFGKACGVKSTPGVYVRVSYYVPWIEGIVWPKRPITAITLARDY